MTVVGLVAVASVLAGCGGSSTASSTTTTATTPTATGTAKVLYAGSLTNLMEHDLGPAFTKATGVQFAGTGAGSTQLVNEIKGKVKQADVFISASTDANTGLKGAANGDWESWYATFATAPLLIGYNPNSTFLHDLKTKPWYQVITEPGFRMGGTDPKLDPKGKLSAQAMTAEKVDPSVVTVFPEEQLVGRLQSGQLDAGFFYSSEAAELHIPTITLAGLTLHATYTVSVLNMAPNSAAGVAFVQYLLGGNGLTYLRAHGLVLQPVKVTGSATDVPAHLRGLLGVG
jgi:molybdate/tungstate transport system substrate-binding protein